MAHEVFVSYASADRDVAMACVEALESSGIDCWVAPRDVAPGEEWAGAIHRAISGSRLMLLVVSPHSDASHHVNREVLLALQGEVTIVPLRVSDFDLNDTLFYALNSVHWLDAMNPPFEAHLARVVDHIGNIIDSSEGSSTRMMVDGNAAFAAAPAEISDKSALVASVLTVFLGWLGVHRFYLGKRWTGLLQMLTLGGFLVWWLVDLFAITYGKMRDRNGLKLKNQGAAAMAWVPFSVVLIAVRGVGMAAA